jgi:site-specific DNA-cytosine methylase
LYWTNIKIDGWHDLNQDVSLKDILEDGFVDRDKSHCIDANYFKGGSMKMYKEKSRRQLVFDTEKKKGCKQVGVADIKGYDIIKRVYDPDYKAPSLTTMQGGWRQPKVATSELYWRNLTPLECERLQTVPDGYTEYGDFLIDPFCARPISNTQRYKMLGNGWTVAVISHIMKNMEK